MITSNFKKWHVKYYNARDDTIGEIELDYPASFQAGMKTIKLEIIERAIEGNILLKDIKILNINKENYKLEMEI